MHPFKKMIYMLRRENTPSTYTAWNFTPNIPTGGVSGESDACALIDPTAIYYTIDNPIVIGTVIYSSTTPLTPIIGDNNWFLETTNRKAYLLNDLGEVVTSGIFTCIPFSFDITMSSSGNDQEDPIYVCTLNEIYTTIYSSTDDIGINTRLFSNPELTIPFTQEFPSWYKIPIHNLSYKVNELGVIIDRYDCNTASIEHGGSEIYKYCDSTVTGTWYCSNNSGLVTFGDRLFEDPTLHIPVVGDPLRWYSLIGTGQTIKIDINGFVIDKDFC